MKELVEAFQMYQEKEKASSYFSLNNGPLFFSFKELKRKKI
jgi:hypothetical protein